MATWTTSTLPARHSEDDAALAKLGYKQEFRRAFTPFEVSSPCVHDKLTSNSHIDVWGCIQLYRTDPFYNVSYPTAPTPIGPTDADKGFSAQLSFMRSRMVGLLRWFGV